MESFSLIWYSFLLVYVQLLVRKVDATITWTLPPPQRGPLAIDDNSPVRTTVKNLDGGSSELRLEWNYTLSGESLSFVTWEIESTTFGRKGSSGAVTVFADFQGHFKISRSDPATVIIQNKTAADGKKFTCTVATNERLSKDVISVVIYEQTKLIGHSGNKTINENSNLTLFCNTTGKPTATVTWTRVLDDGSDGDEIFVGNLWTIGNIKRTMNGTYRCTANNGFGNTVNHSMHVDVTYPVLIKNFPPELLVASFQTVTLQCPAVGNPPPKYTWSPCKKGVCDEPKLNLGEVVSDDVYTCNVTNNLGSDAKNVTLSIAAKTVNVTLVITSKKCADGKYDTSSMEDKLIKSMDIIFKGSDLEYNGAELKGYWPDNETVYMALKFDSITREKDAISKIRFAVINKTTGCLTFNASSITGTRTPPERTTTVSPSPTSPPEGLKLWIIILIVVLVLLFVVLVGNICCWCFSTTICILVVIQCIRKCICKENQDSKEVHTNECQDTERDRGYASDDHQYAVTGPNATYRASNPSSSPLATYEIANRESEGRRGHGASAPKEPLSEYAVVDKTKKKKKTPKPGELQYAELGDLTGRGKKATLPPVSGMSTVYAEVN